MPALWVGCICPLKALLTLRTVMGLGHLSTTSATREVDPEEEGNRQFRHWSMMKPKLSGHLWMRNADMGLRPVFRESLRYGLDPKAELIQAYSTSFSDKSARGLDCPGSKQRSASTWRGRHI